LKTSRCLIIYLLIIYFFAIMALLSAHIMLFLKVIMLFMMGVYMFWITKHSGSLGLSHTIKNIRMMESGQWLLCDKKNQFYIADLHPHTFRTNFLIILVFSVSGKTGRIAVPILKDSLKIGAFSALHFYLFSYRTLRKVPIAFL
ncbi:MAG: protein YgfX, partial [Gammaproteobacteria bacterium]